MKRLLIACSLLLSSAVFAVEPSTPKAEVQIEMNQDKGVETHYYFFGTLPVNFRSYVNYRVTNTGKIPLVFQKARIAGMGFYASHSCKGVLNPGARCGFTIEFAPFFEGYHSGHLLMTFDQGYEILVNLSGHATRY